MRRRSAPRVAVRLAQFVVAGLATWYLALPQVPEAWNAAGALASTRIALTALGAACAIAALFSYAQLMRTALGVRRCPGLWHTFGIITTSLGVSNVLPAGSAFGSVVTFKMLERAGVPRPRAVTAMAVTSVGSAIVLNVLLGLGLIILLPTRGLASGAVATVPALVLLIALAVTCRAAARRRPWLSHVAECAGRRYPRLVGTRATDALDAVADQLDEWRGQPSLWRRTLFWAVSNWLIDVVALWSLLAAVGVVVDPIVVLVAFAVAHVAAMAPITPGGLGVFELTVTAMLVGLGAPAAATAAGVALYRLFSFWMPIPASALSYAATRTMAPRRVVPVGQAAASSSDARSRTTVRVDAALRSSMQ